MITAMGFNVVYRDTDSVFLIKSSRHHLTVGHYLDTLHCILDNMPFRSVRLENLPLPHQCQAQDVLRSGKVQRW